MRLSNTMLAIFVLFFTISLTLGSLTIINKLENYQLQLTGKSTAGQISLNVGLPEQVAAPTPVPTPASGGAGGGGGGRGSKGGATINPDFEVTPTPIHILSKQGQFQRANVVVTNIGSVYLPFKAKIVGLEEFISLDKNDFALPTKESETLVLDIKIPKNKEPDVYTGYLLVETPSVSKKVPIILEVESKKILFDIMTIIPEEYKAIDPGADAWAKITIFNFNSSARRSTSKAKFSFGQRLRLKLPPGLITIKRSSRPMPFSQSKPLIKDRSLSETASPHVLSSTETPKDSTTLR